MHALLGIDVGTSGCKVIATNLQGAIISQGSSHYAINYPRQGWAEQDPQLWYRAACQAIRSCLEHGRISAKAVQALSVTGPAHHVALLDAAGEVLRPTIHWSDLRSVPQCEYLESKLSARLFGITGQRVHPSWTLPQLLWLKDNEPDVWKHLARIFVTKDYVRHCLTGDRLTDGYDAVGTMVCDLRAVSWSEEIQRDVGLPAGAWPEIRMPETLAGKITERAARDTGLLVGTPVAVGSGDSAVEALGVGAVAPGDGIIKLGSSANVDVITSAPQPSLQTITYPYVVSGLGFTVTATNSGAASWKWFREQMIAPSGTKLRDVDLLTLAESIAPGAEGLLFHPYLMGERAPYWDPELRASFVGISARHSLGHFARAVLEGVAFSLRDCLETIEGLGTRVDRCTLLGGGSSSPLWNQIISDVTGLPLRRPAVADASLGAALLAGRAIGVFPDWKSAVATVPPTGAPIDPDDSRHALYSKIFEVYRQSAGLQRQTNARLREALASPNSDDRQSEPTRCGTLASST